MTCIRILLLALFVCPPALRAQAVAPSRATAQRFVQVFYDWYVPRAHALTEQRAYGVAARERASSFDPSFARALEEDARAAEQSAGEIDALDFDPFLATQDGCGRYAVGAVSVSKDRYLVPIYPICQGRKQMSEALTAEVQERYGHWVFVNFHYPGMDDVPPFDLRSVLEQLKEDRCWTSKHC